ncbi:helix-turn-helix domain-containing protein [Desulfofundulus thermobenzoicus]|uniref:Helix-turn-helix domain-containing protein n=1 Tax=Desulfofundulus thermobenzoicus TaxID=29376 RepID=A0A6N7IUP9_9FIRM|nr:helix-turn-helix transcriptional regulator [Desulfofundulus thermobenzoicus]MQL53814.1 helix-turn-helix domain-containing protein [Desulfofundulus thermobenzoicus]
MAVQSREYSAIGKRIREARYKLGLTQEDLGRRAQLHYSYIGQVERGNKLPSLKTLQKIASALNIRLEVLLNDGEELEISPEDLLRRELISLVRHCPADHLRLYINIIQQIKSRLEKTGSRARAEH